MTSALGTTIADYKYRYRNKRKNCPSDILQVIDRLEKYKEYQKQVKKERNEYDSKQQKKILKRVRKESFKKAYSLKPVVNPYVELLISNRQKNNRTVDKNLEEKYKTKNIYEIYEFRHLKLPRSDYEIPAGHAWNGLIKSWLGFKIAKSNDDTDLMTNYAHATQKWTHMLELQYIPEFEELGVTLAKFENSLKIRLKD